MSLPCSPASGWTKPWTGTQPCSFAEALIPAFDCYRVGRFPAGSLRNHPQLPATSHTLSGRGRISTVKQELLRLWLTASKRVGNYVIFLQRANSNEELRA